MFTFMTRARVRRNIELFLDHVDPDGDAAGPLGPRFFRGLRRIQRHFYPYDPTGAGPLRLFDLHDPEIAEAVRHFMELADVDDTHACSSDEHAGVHRGLDAGLDLLDGYDPELRELATLTIGAIFFASREGYGGGSVGGTSGLIWLNPSEAVDDDEYAAKLAHELTHQCLFLHEMIHALFTVDPPRMSEDDMLVTSALLRQRRGYARSFHSACVAAVLVDYFDHRGLADRAAPIWDGLQVTAAQLRALAGRTSCLTAGGEQVLAEMERFIAGRAVPTDSRA